MNALQMMISKYWFLIALTVVITICLNGCSTSRRYHPPTKDFYVEVKNDKGQVTEVRGALMEEKSEFTLGTKGQDRFSAVNFESKEE